MSFIQNIISSEKSLLVVDCYSNWCGPCKVISPKVDTLNELFGDYVRVEKIDIEEDEFQSFVEEHNIQNLPTFLFFKDGKEIDRYVGSNFEKLQERISRLL
jgi:thioredoxin 1